MSAQMQELLVRGEELFAALERETCDCMQKLESLPAAEIERFVARRHEIISAIRALFAELYLYLNGADRFGDGGATVSLEKFRERQTRVLCRVIEAEGILLALAERTKATLRDRLAAIGQGRRALAGYRGKGGTPLASLDRTA